MKAISIKQPWAHLIIQGKKTIEIRSQGTNYRGKLIIHASGNLDKNDFLNANIDLKTMDSFDQKKLIGVVDLINVVKLDSDLWEKLRGQHIIPGRWIEIRHKYAWIFKDPQPIDPIEYNGLPSMFSVNPEIESKILLVIS